MNVPPSQNSTTPVSNDGIPRASGPEIPKEVRKVVPLRRSGNRGGRVARSSTTVSVLPCLIFSS
jgi:hypothetical protein